MASELSLKTTMEFAYGAPRKLAAGVVRIVANNPSPFTFKGTNTYIVGEDEVAVIDPGPEDEAHRAAILAALAGRKVTHIVVTHTHRDHVDGLPGLVAALGAPTCGFGRHAEMEGMPRLGASGSEFVDQSFVPDIAMTHGDAISGSGWRLEAIHTPGHAPDHLCFALEGTGLVFSGDHVMAWNTSVVAPPEGSMADYMASLERLLARTDDTSYLPGHGGRVEHPRKFVKAFLVHRTMREQAILSAIRDGRGSIGEIVAAVYRGLDERLIRAAGLSVQAHVEHLIDRGLVTCEGSFAAHHVLTAAR